MLDDLLAATRLLQTLPPADRAPMADRLIHQAHAAHHYHRRMGRPHPLWGNGSLMARALAGCQDPAAALDHGALAIMAAAVQRFRDRCNPRAPGLS